MSGQRHDLDHEMARSVSHWLATSNDSLPENPSGQSRLLDALDATPQRAHRWLPPIGRGRMRPVLDALQAAAAVLVIVLAGGFLLLSVVPDRDADSMAPAALSPSPSAMDAYVPGTVTHVTGIVIEQRIDVTGQSVEQVEGAVRRRGSVIVRDNQWSDDRLPARMRFSVNSDEYRVEQGAETGPAWIGQGIAILRDEAGTWTGTGQLLEYPGGDTHDEWYELVGSGAYMGLTAILRNHNELDQERKVWVSSWEGLIVEGELPPMPEALPTMPA